MVLPVSIAVCALTLLTRGEQVTAERMLICMGMLTMFNVLLTCSILRLYANVMHKRHQLDSGLFELANLRKIQAGRIDQ